MNKIQNIMMELIKISLNPELEKNTRISKNEWPELYKIIIQQRVALTLFPLLDLLAYQDRPDDLLYKQWKNQVLFATAMQFRKIQQLKAIMNVFRSVGLPFILLKGLAIARFYNQPEYRLMSDLDILVENKYIPLARKTIESMEYNLRGNKKNHPFHYGYDKPGELYIELHHSLLEPGILGWRKMDGWYEHIWQHRKNVSFDGIEFSVMAEEDQIIHQILHFATHMIHAGARMSHIYDIALIIKRCGKDLDWQYMINTMETMQLLKLGLLIFNICYTYFQISIPDWLINQKVIYPEDFIERFLDEYSVQKEGSDKSTWDRLVAWNHPFVCKSILAIPLVCIIEFTVQLIKNRRTVRDSMVMTHNNIKVFLDTTRTLRILRLIN